jgi:hypothetical protein
MENPALLRIKAAVACHSPQLNFGDKEQPKSGIIAPRLRKNANSYPATSLPKRTTLQRPVSLVFSHVK